MVSDRYLEWDVQSWDPGEYSQAEPNAVLHDRFTWQTDLTVGLESVVHFEEGDHSLLPRAFIDSVSVADRLLTLGIRGFAGHPLVSPSFVRSLIETLMDAFGQPVLELRLSDEAAAREPRIRAFLDGLIDEGVAESVKEYQWRAELPSQDVLARAVHLMVGSGQDYRIEFGDVSFVDHDATALFLAGSPDALETALSCVQQVAVKEGFELQPRSSS